MPQGGWSLIKITNKHTNKHLHIPVEVYDGQAVSVLVVGGAKEGHDVLPRGGAYEAARGLHVRRSTRGGSG